MYRFRPSAPVLTYRSHVCRKSAASEVARLKRTHEIGAVGIEYSHTATPMPYLTIIDCFTGSFGRCLRFIGRLYLVFTVRIKTLYLRGVGSALRFIGAMYEAGQERRYQMRSVRGARLLQQILPFRAAPLACTVLFLSLSRRLDGYRDAS
jgi:hypothetical protein